MKDMMNEDNSDSKEDTTLAELARGTAAPARRLGTVAPTVAPAAGETAVAPAAGLSPLKKIWDDQFCNQCIVDNVPGWECLRCGKKFKPCHHTRAVAHFAKIPNQGVALCSSLISDFEFKRYVELWENTKKRKLEMTYMRVSIMEDKEDKLTSSAEKWVVEQNMKPKVATEIERYFDMTGKTKSSRQCAIDTAFQKMKQSDLNSVNHARMDMAVATFFHENIISDRAVESPSFKIMLKYARLVGQEYKVPTRKGIGGPLLDINYNNIVENNKEILCRESDVFGLCWLSDGATIARMPLLNVLGLCADTPPHMCCY
jgi:hypothetical protein